jgi:hypothetical protein
MTSEHIPPAIEHIRASGGSARPLDDPKFPNWWAISHAFKAGYRPYNGFVHLNDEGKIDRIVDFLSDDDAVPTEPVPGSADDVERASFRRTDDDYAEAILDAQDAAGERSDDDDEDEEPHCEACGAYDDGSQSYCEQCGEPLVDHDPAMHDDDDVALNPFPAQLDDLRLWAQLAVLCRIVAESGGWDRTKLTDLVDLASTSAEALRRRYEAIE